MRPPSIAMFERLFLASLVVSLLSFVVGYDAMAAQFANNPGMQKLGMGAGFLIGSVIVSLAIYLLLWFLIARKASNAAKWVLVVFLVLGLLSLVASLLTPGFAQDWTLTRILGLVVYALEIASLVYLFRPDAKAWLKGEQEGDPSTFD